MWRHVSITPIFLCAVFMAAQAKTVCYEDIGCFDNGSPFYQIPDRPISWLPESRDEIGTEFRLNTRSNPNPDGYEVLSTYDSATITNSYFDGLKDTKVITHGFIQGANVDWMHEMMTEFLIHGDYNVIRVDWQFGGSIDLYGKSAANTRIVGAEISLLIDQLKSLTGVTADSFHIIGHSLGAHVAGYAGERQTSPQVARITGLDPAGPYFEDMDPVVRLDPTDAAFVDVIHSDTDPLYTLGYGMYAPCGHMDYFPNGGRKQPGCDQNIFEFIAGEGGIWDGTVQAVACNHLRAIDYFTESINSQCPFRSYQCTRDHDDYNYGLCFDNSLSARMGYESPSDYPVNANDYLIYQINTQSSYPFGGYQYRFTIKLDNGWGDGTFEGLMWIKLFGSTTQSSWFPLTLEPKDYSPDSLYVSVALSDVYPSTLSGLYFGWEYFGNWWWWNWEMFERPKMYIHQIFVDDGELDMSYTMCAGYDAIWPGDIVAFAPTQTVCP